MLIVYHHLFLSYQQSTEYEIVLGRKNVAVKLIITFDKKDCFHLMGLQYLTDRPELRRDRGKIFDEIQNGIIKRENKMCIRDRYNTAVISGQGFFS